MLYLYHSNDLELLKELLAQQIRQDSTSIFGQEAILVQSQGMSHWLKLQLAERLGISAQIEFPLPSKFIWRVFNALNPNLPKRTHFDKQIMAWKLMQLLPELAREPEYAVIADYLEFAQEQPNQFNPIKCYQLAQNIADTFDQYLIYRPHWLLEWEQGSNAVGPHELGVHAWQPALWRALVANTPQQLADGTLPQEHRARVHLNLQELVESNAHAFAKLPKRLFVFGIATLPKVYWEVLQAISSRMDVHFYLLNPCNEFAGDIVTSRQALKALRRQQQGDIHLDVGNPLLASWGKLGREFLQFVQQQGTGVAEFDVFYQDENRQHLLSQVQRDILGLKHGGEGAFTTEALKNSHFKRTVAADDGSIRCVSGHSPLRELQRLYDQILYWLETDPNLKPRDIVVMVPDINEYAPYIDAVFASHKAQVAGSEQEYRIPWAIADQAIAAENPVIESFLSLLKLPDSRFLNSEIMDLLNVPAIARQFALTQDDLDTIKDWLVQAEIRWGLDGKQRASLDLPAFEQNSWRTGLRQMLLGAMLPNNALSSGGYQGDFPVFATEGNDSERLGKLMDFIDQLAALREELICRARPLDDWATVLDNLLKTFYAAEEAEIYALQSIRQALDEWQQDTELANFTGELTSEVVAAWFHDHLGQQTGWQRFLAGPVNFCSLMPMRSIPFKAVCMLGMNDSDYPRPSTPLGFDLIQRFPEKGDRARREDDRYLFLEALCSAQDYLYLSYRGHDVRTNSEQQPSVLLAELRDYLADSFCLSGSEHLPHNDSRQQFLHWLEEELPLQPYNASTFAPVHPRAVASYQSLWAQVSQADTQANSLPQNWPQQPLALPEDKDFLQIEWRDVVEALTLPPKFFVRRRLEAYFDIDWQEQEDNEPFGLDNLSQYQLKADWLARVQHSFETEQTADFQPENYQALATDFTQQQHALGRIPVNEIGRKINQLQTELLQPLASTLLPLLAAPHLGNRAVEVTLAGSRIHGELNNLYQQADGSYYLLSYQVGKLRGRQLLVAWLNLLLASYITDSNINVQQAHIYSVEDKGIQRMCLQLPPAEQVAELMELALHWYRQIWQQPVPHFPDALWQAINEFASIDSNEKHDDEEKANRRRKVVTGMLDNQYSQLNDLYSQRCLAGFLADLPESYELWLNEYGGLMQALFAHSDAQWVEA